MGDRRLRGRQDLKSRLCSAHVVWLSTWLRPGFVIVSQLYATIIAIIDCDTTVNCLGRALALLVGLPLEGCIVLGSGAYSHTRGELLAMPQSGVVAWRPMLYCDTWGQQNMVDDTDADNYFCTWQCCIVDVEEDADEDDND
ncbi:hypothetical protein RRG08_053565 [Elysia crispata]|uniref:Uncharacterized protein n=1 Tax=Elysia crispata TaxID=231223 RepID=A0AAE0Y181_9GAST|nr:hypothetical protein RRG08_053565 [Elysia crispata]